MASYSQRSLGDRDDIIQSQKPERLIDLWLLGGFVGALEPSQCYYVWDQCFIQGWQELPKFCLLVLGAMEAKIMGLLDAGELYDAFTTNCQVPWDIFLSRPH